MFCRVLVLVLCFFMFPVYANMCVGDEGNEVLAVQKKLVSSGYFIQNMNGCFDLQMENAVKSFQADNKLPLTGEMDKETYLKLMNTTLPDRFSGNGNISLIRRLVAAAMALHGVPYVFGGTSPYGFDCSGFVQYVLRQAGIAIPRMADEQYYASTKLSNPKLGDLVFFTTYCPGVSHVGIYLGDNKFIHASSSKGVTVSSLMEDYWKNCYVGAGRVIASNR